MFSYTEVEEPIARTPASTITTAPPTSCETGEVKELTPSAL